MRDIILRCIQTDFKREHRTNQDRPKYFSSLPGKGEILAQDEATFLNSVSLLCEVFEHLRLADGTVINVLAVRKSTKTNRNLMSTAKVPILEYCTLLLDSPSPPGVALLGKQLQVSLLNRILMHKKTQSLIFLCQAIGEDVHRSKPEKFSDLLLKVRQTLVNPPPNLQSDSLATLLLLLESHLLRWPSVLPEKTG